MNKKEVVEVIKSISTYYGNKFKMDDPVAIVETWLKILKDYEFDIVESNLVDYVKNNHFPPSVADLVKVAELKDRAIPTREETLLLFKKWDQERSGAADAETAKKALEAMRKTLGINRVSN